MVKKDLINKLKSIDLNEKEAVIYCELIDQKEAPAGDLIKKTGFHRNVVYTSLDHLKNKKLVTEKTKKGKKYYVPDSPDILLEDLKEKEKIAENLNKQIKNELSEDIESISIHEGNDEYFKLLASIINQMENGDTKYILGAGGESFMENTMRPIWKKYHEVAAKQGIKIKMLAYNDQSKGMSKDLEDYKEIYETKYISGDEKNPAGLHIYPKLNTVLNIIYSDDNSPVKAIKIKDKRLTEGYMNLFKNLWDKN